MEILFKGKTILVTGAGHGKSPILNIIILDFNTFNLY